MSHTSEVYVDACCRVENAHKKGRVGYGKCACGVLIINEKEEEYIFSKYLGDKTVPEAEFEGLLLGLDKASEVVNRKFELRVWMDSELVIKWMNKEYKLHKDHIKPLYDEAVRLSLRFKKVEYLHHSRETEMARRVDKIAQDEYERHNK